MVYGISIISAMFVLTFSFIIIITLPGNENNLTEWMEGRNFIGMLSFVEVSFLGSSD